MPYINITNAAKLARLQALNASIGAGAQIVVYDGAYPATPDLPPSANALVTFACNAATFGTTGLQATATGNAVVGVATLTAQPIAPQFSQGNGQASWARIGTAGGVAVVDLDVATAGASITMDATDLVGNIAVQIASITITEP